MEKKFQIQIENILGGHSPTSNFSSSSQFRASIGIDPAQPIDDLDTIYSTVASGYLRPVPSEKISSSTLTSAPLWMKPTPKDANVYVYDALGSAYTIDATLTTFTALSDAGALSNAKGNGMAYYDNYVYFFKNTTVARYGPLNGTPAFNEDYWVTTLAKTALVDTTYPTTYKNNIQLPNHVAVRHSDGALYFGDVVGNQGYLHKIKTTKTTVEGDTDSGSIYQKLAFGYGLWPTAIESVGSEVVVALYEGSNTGLRQETAKIAFWDTTSTNFNKVTWKEFPDPIISAMKNVNGTLYVVSGNYRTAGFRVSRFLGGYSFQEVYYSETGEPCLPGAIDAVLNRVGIGSYTTIPDSDGCVYSIGLQKSALGSGMFNIMRSTGGDSSTCVTAVAFAEAYPTGFSVPIIGWTRGSTSGSNNGVDKQGSSYGNTFPAFWSSTYRIGKSFKITKITIPLAQTITTNMILNPKIYFDDGRTSLTLPVVSNSNYSGAKTIILRPENASGDTNFWLELRWTGLALLTVGLPITIEGEYYDED